MRRKNSAEVRGWKHRAEKGRLALAPGLVRVVVVRRERLSALSSRHVSGMMSSFVVNSLAMKPSAAAIRHRRTASRIAIFSLAAWSILGIEAAVWSPAFVIYQIKACMAACGLSESTPEECCCEKLGLSACFCPTKGHSHASHSDSGGHASHSHTEEHASHAHSAEEKPELADSDPVPQSTVSLELPARFRFGIVGLTESKFESAPDVSFIIDSILPDDLRPAIDYRSYLPTLPRPPPTGSQVVQRRH